jgi:alkylation response protein AidB-like acyl-CoA dehydrogenase
VDLELNDDQRLFQETIRQFIESEVPIPEVRRLAREAAGFEREWWVSAAGLGWTSLLVGEDNHGGSLSGNGLADLAIVAEEFGRAVAPGPLLGCNLVARALDAAAQAGDRSHDDDLKAVLAGEMVASWAFRDAGGSWHPRSPTLTAERDGDDFVLSGRKTTVEFGGQADAILVTAATAAGPTQFLVPSGTGGVRIEPLEALDLVRRYADVVLSGVRVPREAVVGEAGGAGPVIDDLLRHLLVLQCAEMAGAADRVFAMTTAWAADRYSFGRPLNSYQALKHRFADMKTALEASHAATTGAAAAVGSGDPDAGRMASAAKAYVADRATEIIQDCVQLHGGIGVTWEHDIHLYLRRVTTDRGLAGTPRDHLRYLGDLTMSRESQ